MTTTPILNDATNTPRAHYIPLDIVRRIHDFSNIDTQVQLNRIFGWLPQKIVPDDRWGAIDTLLQHKIRNQKQVRHPSGTINRYCSCKPPSCGYICNRIRFNTDGDTFHIYRTNCGKDVYMQFKMHGKFFCYPAFTTLRRF